MSDDARPFAHLGTENADTDRVTSVEDFHRARSPCQLTATPARRPQV